MKLKHITTTTLISLSFAASLMAQSKADPFVKSGKPQPAAVANKPVAEEAATHAILFEAFSLPLKDAAELMRSGNTDEQTYQSLVQKGKQEVLVVLRGTSGQKITNEAVREMIYPTEYEAPKVPTTLGVNISPMGNKGVDKSGESSADQTENLSKAPSVKSLEGLKVPVTPSAFETRNVGVTVETEFLLAGNNDGTCDLIIAPEFINHIGESVAGQGVAETTMPVFETQRLQTNVTLNIGKPYLLGTMNRPPSSKLDGDLPNRVWFATVTVRPVKP
ncbi:hypothetical protein NT6N_12710 [Oceaniferula spumae]|uniref:Uncharacterized protein n=1 Tax=Oceaniferula spumae TaxID=2979115 RepID=A0AAT9FJH5_9BACT